MSKVDNGRLIIVSEETVAKKLLNISKETCTLVKIINVFICLYMFLYVQQDILHHGLVCSLYASSDS